MDEKFLLIMIFYRFFINAKIAGSSVNNVNLDDQSSKMLIHPQNFQYKILTKDESNFNRCQSRVRSNIDEYVNYAVL